MTCNNSCGPCMTHEQIVTYVENLVNQMILCGSIQAGLRACGSSCDNGPILPGGTNIVTCEQLASLVDEAIKSGQIDIPGIESLKFDGTRITLVDQSGTSHQIDLSSLTDKTVQSFVLDAAGVLTLTLGDGTEYSVNLKELLAAMVGDAAVKNGFLDQDGNLVLTDGAGNLITVDMSALKGIVIDRDSPLTGDGTEENPLSIDFSRVCWQVIEDMTFTTDGLSIKIANQCDAVTLPLADILAVLNNKVAICIDTEQGIITGNGSDGKCLSLDLDKLVSLLINNQTLINNIAAALDYKIKVAVTQGVTGDGTTANPLNVKLSTDSGNLLSLRDNGLYYGTEATADITNLYVDPSTGSDSNPGTRALPLATLNRAIAMVGQAVSNTIWLRAGQVVILDRELYVSGGATRTIAVYGDPHSTGGALYPDYPSVNVPHYYPEIVAELARPTIKSWVVYNETTQKISIPSMRPMNGGQLVILGCHLDAKPVNDVDTGHTSIPAGFSKWARLTTGMIYGNASGTTTLRGCTFSVPACPADYIPEGGSATSSPWWNIISTNAVGEVTAVQINRCFWNTGGNVGLMDMNAASSRLYVTTWPTNPAAVASQYPDLTENMLARLIETSAVRGITRDADGKPRNITSNLVL